MIVTIAEHQHLNNDYRCSFCDGQCGSVVGRAYFQTPYDHPQKHYMFAYCAKCGIEQSGKMASLVHPGYRVQKITVQSND